jgi:hypothetical protein
MRVNELHPSISLVSVEDERDALLAALVLQEMGLSVHFTDGEEGALEYALHADYAVVVCGRYEQRHGAAFAIRLRSSAPLTRVILLADPELVRDELDGLGVEVIPTPVNVNALVERLLPQHPG